MENKKGGSVQQRSRSSPVHWHRAEGWCYDCAQKDLVSVVMTTRAESMISRGLIRVLVLGRLCGALAYCSVSSHVLVAD
jgi:hypothetical protein